MTLRGSSRHQNRSEGIVVHNSGLGALAMGLVAAGVLTLSLLAALTVGLEEAHLVAQVQPSPSPTRVATRIAMPAASATPTAAAVVPTPTTALPPTSEPAWTPEPSPTCAVPGSWNAYRVQTGESLSSLARRYGTTEAALQQANCLPSPHLTRGQILYVPKVVATSTPCIHPRDWVRYYVKKGDTLLELARQVGSTVAALKQANCRQNDTIYIGEALWVPRLPVEPVDTVRPSPTRQPTRTPTRTPTLTLSPTPAESGTVEPSSTPEPSPTEGVEPTDTPTEAAPGETPVPSDTPPPEPTDTPRPEPTDTPRPPDPTDTPRPEPTDTPRPPDPTEAPAPTDETVPPGEP